MVNQFQDFLRDTRIIGEKRVKSVNGFCDELIPLGQSDAAAIADWIVNKKINYMTDS